MTARMRQVCMASAVVAASTACTPPIEPADLVLRHGRIVTMDDVMPEAQALAARGGRIVAVGRDAEMERYISPSTTVIDLAGRLATPGFIEGHGHFLGVGDAKLQLDLTDARTWAEVVAMVADAAARARPGELVRGRGWHQDEWNPLPSPVVQGLPLHDDLSAVSPDNPVLLVHASGHATFANRRAMELAGISRQMRNPAGGVIVRDREGDPTGAFLETAAALLDRVRESAAPADPHRQAELAQREALSKGITTFQDAGSSFEAADLFKAMIDDGSLSLRLWVMLQEANERLASRMADYRLVGHGGDRLTVRAIKRSIDGALGSRGAWLLEPYADLAATTGLNTTPVEQIEEAARLAIANGFQLCVHAIGDRANRETLDLYERMFAAHPGDADLRWRIEHAQHLHPDDIPRFAALGVIASMQGVHATSDGSWVPDRLGARRTEEGAYVWQKLLQSGAVVVNGTDAPVEDVNPIRSFYASVSRRLADGSVFYPDQRMSRLEALRSYTLSAAYAGFEEHIKGSLTPGKLADVVVLSKDILTILEEEIPTTQIVYTIIGGRVVYEADVAH